MEQRQVSPENHRRVVLAYHGLPVLTAVALVGIFLAVFFLSGSLYPTGGPMSGGLPTCMES